ncbi:MAG: GntR family transcriptional regulator, partial [Alphaproteobacteria bacterium]
SRTPIREALRWLAAKGLVAFERNQGTFVANFSQDDVDEVFHLRAMLEAHSAARAARRITDAQLAALEANTAELEALKSGGTADYAHRFNALNNRFHTIIMEAAHSKRLELMLAQVIDIPLILMKHYNWGTRINIERSCHQHWELIAALRNRDEAWSRSLMAAHVLGARGERGGLMPELAEAPTVVAQPKRRKN